MKGRLALFDISNIEKFFQGTFKVLNGLPRYVALEENEAQPDPDFKEKISHLVEAGEVNKLHYISVLIQKSNHDYMSILVNNGFQYRSSILEYTKELGSVDEYPPPFQWKSLKDVLSEEEFKNIWERCMLFSDNKPSTLSMNQHLDSVKTELGDNWRNSCRVFINEENPIAVVIPHIEPGTTDEGRLFYFGIIPEERGKGLGSILHKQSLRFLKEIGATYYVGGTHSTNIKMQHIFKSNGCRLKSEMESYYKYF
ncbi:GNAT family N-acetyltransferase [Heyndrickxia shackletonii]|uniref:GNAT family N-acetyltransferase n=1 Tax=Heyndrickxia shackletonii TaxID=157838 RepID=UPI0006EC349E|nr:GNAT family N-acetyltransferase [Heyndrickxia shackletonii]NEZ00271.1 GNAT family N-acetyltransferase [Heyndrickxia shackletonii]